MPPIAAAGRPSVGALALLLMALPAAAMELPIDPKIGRYERQLRNLQGQAASNPGAAAREAARLRRELINETGGVNFDADEARIDRGLRAVEEAGRGTVEAPAPERAEPDGIQLPSTIEGDPGALPSMQRELRLTRRLLDRAEQGIGDRDPNQAASDLAAAEASIIGLREAAPAAEVQPLADRLASLRQRLASVAPDDGTGSSLSPELRNAPLSPPASNGG